jgi:hypothetical protein
MSHLAKPWIICCCKDGSLSLRQRWHRAFNGAALPVWSCDTATEAEALIGLCGAQTLDRYGKPVDHPDPNYAGPWIRIDAFGPELELDHLTLVTERFALASAMRKGAKP